MPNESIVDPFEGCVPFPGLEHLGRAIVDAQGQPSGSPANYEATRGVAADYNSVPLMAAADIDAIVDRIEREFAGESEVRNG